MSKECDTAKETIYKQLIQRKRQRESARNVKYTLKKLNGKGVTRVEIPLENEGVEEATTKEAIEQACMAENHAKYTQTRFTPCLQEPLFSMLNLDANTPSGQDILDGTFNVPPNTAPYAQEFFDQMKQEEIHDDIPESYLSSEMF